MIFRKTLLSAAAATTCAFVFVGGAAAQTPADQQMQAAPVSEEEIKQFAKADQKVVEISEKWTPQLETAATTEEAESMQVEAQAEMVAAIEDEGLSVQRYNEIFAAAQADPSLAERIRASV